MLRTTKIEDAVGLILGHDVPRLSPVNSRALFSGGVTLYKKKTCRSY